jgi:hypothetical protein
MIKEVPTYPTPSKNDSVKNEAKASAAQTHVGTAAPGCPGGADVSRRGSSAPATQKKPSASVKQPTKSVAAHREGHDFSRADNAPTRAAASAAEGLAAANDSRLR